MTFLPAGQATPVTLNVMPKSVMEGFDPEFGRITAQFGVEVPAVPNQTLEQGIGYFNNDPETEVFANTLPGTLIGTQADGTQIWKITHNGVDTHIVHVHMYNLQVINRVYWDGTIVPPDPNEVGWKESVQINPLQDLVVAMRPIAPNIPWELPNSVRLLNAVTANGSAKPMEFTNLDPQGNQINVVNHVVNFGWEYVWHCHLLGHEENDMMRSQSVAVAPKFAPGSLTAVSGGANRVNLTWTDTTVSETDWTIQRATAAAGPWSDLAQIPSTTGPQKGGSVQYSDPTAVSPFFYRVLATNVVGDRTVYAGSSGYPTVTVNSTPSNVASPSAVAASITVVSPNGGEVWAQNTTHPITWSYTGTPGSAVKIDLMKNGIFYQAIVASTPIGSAGSGSYSWTIRTISTPGTTYRVRVTSTTNATVNDTSNANFAITAAGALPALTVSASPTSVIVRTPTAVTFTVKNQTSGLVVNGATVTLTGVATGSGVTGANGNTTISVNASAAGTVTATATLAGYTNGVTTVTATAAPSASSITVVSPNGGEAWVRNTTHPITWSYTGSPGPAVKIDLMKNGIFYQAITASTPVGSAGSGSYPWNIRSITTLGTTYRVTGYKHKQLNR